MQYRAFDKGLKKDFEFFDLEYFKTRPKALIDIFFTGNGQPGCIIFSRIERVYFRDFFNMCFKHTAKVAANLYEAGAQAHSFMSSFEEKKTGLGFFIKFYVDTCYAGSALEVGTKWTQEKEGQLLVD